MRVSASFKIIPRRGSVRVRNRGRSVRVRIPSRGGKGLSPGVFLVENCIRGEFSSVGYLLESSMPAVLITGPTVTQSSPFLP